ncbi:MAG: hypothetical protein R2774_06210 [Saprospiraceae bacterium]
MKNKFLALLAAFMFCSVISYGQSYNSAIGARLGYPLSLSYKKFISDRAAVEGILGFKSYTGYSWINVGGLYEIHNELPSIDGLSWYYGAGASIYLWSYDNDFIDAGSSTSIGISGVIGLDYRFADIPLNISIDWIPTFFVNGYGNGFGSEYGGIGVRYILN